MQGREGGNARHLGGHLLSVHGHELGGLQVPPQHLGPEVRIVLVRQVELDAAVTRPVLPVHAPCANGNVPFIINIYFQSPS